MASKARQRSDRPRVDRNRAVRERILEAARRRRDRVMLHDRVRLRIILDPTGCDPADLERFEQALGRSGATVREAPAPGRSGKGSG